MRTGSHDNINPFHRVDDFAAIPFALFETLFPQFRRTKFHTQRRLCHMHHMLKWPERRLHVLSDELVPHIRESFSTIERPTILCALTISLELHGQKVLKHRYLTITNSDQVT